RRDRDAELLARRREPGDVDRVGGDRLGEDGRALAGDRGLHRVLAGGDVDGQRLHARRARLVGALGVVRLLLNAPEDRRRALVEALQLLRDERGAGLLHELLALLERLPDVGVRDVARAAEIL